MREITTAKLAGRADWQVSILSLASFCLLSALGSTLKGSRSLPGQACGARAPNGPPPSTPRQFLHALTRPRADARGPSLALQSVAAIVAAGDVPEHKGTESQSFRCPSRVLFWAPFPAPIPSRFVRFLAVFRHCCMAQESLAIRVNPTLSVTFDGIFDGIGFAPDRGETWANFPASPSRRRSSWSKRLGVYLRHMSVIGFDPLAVRRPSLYGSWIYSGLWTDGSLPWNRNRSGLQGSMTWV